MDEFIECSGLLNMEQHELNEECIKEQLKTCYPTEVCYHEDQETDSEEDYEGVTENLSPSFISCSSEKSIKVLEAEEGQEKSIEKQMSFLRASQILIDPNDCLNIWKQFESVQEVGELGAAKSAMKLAKRKARAAARTAAKKGEKECFGDVDKKPQWVVEWTDRASKY